MLVGSWGKATEVRPPRDIDVLFALPKAVYDRYETRPGNKQSQLLQEVKDVLTRTYPTTNMRGDGQVVMIPFTTYAVELVPAFLLTTGGYWVCDTNGGGRYKALDPGAEITHVQQSDSGSSGNTRHLIKMMKRWQEYCSVPLKSFAIELLAVHFINSWQNRSKDFFWYDFMVRDFLAFLVSCAGKWIAVPGTGEHLLLGDTWKSRAESAYARAVNACGYETTNALLAGQEWQKIFGPDIPSN
jgi:hypothetical protein